MIIGYWLYGRALKTLSSDFIKFCTTKNVSDDFSMENAHNILHNNQGYIIRDAQYSITSPIFFAFHSCIDLML
jgi:hypothetical protein